MHAAPVTTGMPLAGHAGIRNEVRLTRAGTRAACLADRDLAELATRR
ncbi:MAG: hypothetical protein JWM19_4625 [Actinomycetia bacterium]|nr:hypothetical protein [Actinomycetes bacterium]